MRLLLVSGRVVLIQHLQRRGCHWIPMEVLTHFAITACHLNVIRLMDVDGWNPVDNHRLDVQKPCKSWDKLPTSTGFNWCSPDFGHQQYEFQTQKYFPSRCETVRMFRPPTTCPGASGLPLGCVSIPFSESQACEWQVYSLTVYDYRVCIHTLNIILVTGYI